MAVLLQAASEMDVSAARTVDGPATARCADGSPRIQLTSVASRVILAFRSLETGQPALALAASSSNFASSAPGTLAFNVRCTAVMAKPSATWRVKPRERHIQAQAISAPWIYGAFSY